MGLRFVCFGCFRFRFELSGGCTTPDGYVGFVYLGVMAGGDGVGV